MVPSPTKRKNRQNQYLPLRKVWITSRFQTHCALKGFTHTWIKIQTNKYCTIQCSKARWICVSGSPLSVNKAKHVRRVVDLGMRPSENNGGGSLVWVYPCTTLVLLRIWQSHIVCSARRPCMPICVIYIAMFNPINPDDCFEVYHTQYFNILSWTDWVSSEFVCQVYLVYYRFITFRIWSTSVCILHAIW